MNKLLVSDSIKLNNGSYILNCQSNIINIEIDGLVKVYLLNENITKLLIKMTDNSCLTLYKFNKNVDSNREVEIIQNNNTKVFYNESFLNNNDTNLIINNYLNNDNNESNINIRNISNKNNSSIIINVNILKNTINNLALENLKGITNGGEVKIEPNIICDSNEVIANHLTTIGCLNQVDLDYLLSKGLREEKAKELLLNGFILSNMDDYIKELMEVI